MKKYAGYLIDLDGTIYQGTQQIPAAKRFVERLQSNNIPFLFVTNNSTKSPEYVVDNLKNNHDIQVNESNVYTSSQATADYLSEYNKLSNPTVYIIGESGLKNEILKQGFIFNDINPDYVIVGLDTDLTYNKLKKATLAIRNGAKFIGTNPDSNVPSEQGMIPGAGSLIQLIEYATNVSPIIIGKPEPTVLNNALIKLGTDRDLTLVVGDNYHTDIQAAINSKMDSLLVYTGLSKREEVTEELVAPTYEIDSLDDWEL